MATARPLFNVRQYIHESNLIEGFDSPEADKALYAAWEYLCTDANSRPFLNRGRIQETHSRAVAFQDNALSIWPGAYRDRSRVNVTIAGRPGLAPDKIQAAMDDWLAHWSEHTPRENHILFEKIHPFIDGNGRVGRLLMWYQERYIDNVKPTLIRKQDAETYYGWFA